MNNQSPIEMLAAFTIVFALGALSAVLLPAYVRHAKKERLA